MFRPGPVCGAVSSCRAAALLIQLGSPRLVCCACAAWLTRWPRARAAVWDHLEVQNPLYFKQYNATRCALVRRAPACQAPAMPSRKLLADECGAPRVQAAEAKSSPGFAARRHGADLRRAVCLLRLRRGKGEPGGRRGGASLPSAVAG